LIANFINNWQLAIYNFNMKRLTFFTFCIALFFGCSQERQVKVIKLGHGLDVSHSVHKGMLYMSDVLEEKSGGTMRIDVYPSEQLGTERQCLELLQIGSMGMTKVSAAVLENFAPSTKVLTLPYIFRDTEHAYEVLDGPIGQELLQQSEKYWLRGIAYFDSGWRSFYTKDTKVQVPEDLDGMKIRVQESQTAMNMVRLLGGSPTPISFGELYTALQQGIVDGAENNPPSMYLTRHYEVCKYYGLNEHTYVPDVLLVSVHLWEDLSEQEQQWLQEAAQEATAYQRKLWDESVQESMDQMREAGVEIYRPDKAPFMAKVAPMYEDYRDQPEIYDLIQRIQAVGK